MQARVKGIVNCAVAAKEGRDVVVIDSCHGAPKVQFASKALPNPNTVVSKLPGNLYQVRVEIIVLKVLCLVSAVPLATLYCQHF